MLNLLRKTRNNAVLMDSIKTSPKTSTEDEVVKPPPGMCIIYHDDYDIRIVDRAVRSMFKYLRYTLPELEQELKTEKQLLLNVSSVVDYNTMSKSITSLENKIKNIIEDTDVNHYITTSKILLEKYKTLAKAVEVVDINLIRDKTDDLTALDLERIMVIEDYFRLASKYIDLDWVHESPSSNGENYCQGCGYDLDETPSNQDGCKVCPQCGVLKYITTIEKVTDINQEVYTTKEYCDETNFKKAFNRMICQQEITYNMAELVEELDRFFQSHNGKPASYYRSQQVLRGWKKEGTNLKMLIYGLKSIGRSELYEDYNIIGCNLWGWNVPDASYLEEIIMSDYRETQKVYAMMDKKKIERSSCPSTQLRLFKHLQLRGFECVISDFKVPVQYETMRKQESIWEEMCNNTNNPSIYYIRSSNS